MLPQTRIATDNLLQAGLTRHQFRVRTPWNQKKQAYEETHIVVFLPFRELRPFIENLSAYFMVTVFFIDTVPFHVSVALSKTPGLYKHSDGMDRPMSIEELDAKGCIEQLVLW